MPPPPRPPRRGSGWLQVAGVLGLVAVVAVVLGLAAVAGVDAMEVRFPDPATGLPTRPGPSLSDASAREGWGAVAVGAASAVAAAGALLLHLRRRGG